MSRTRRRYLVGAEAVAAAGVAAALVITAGSGSGPNYMPAPTIACLRAHGFTIGWQSPAYRLRQARDWASVGVSRNGYGLSATFAPSPALAREMAPTSGFSRADPWLRRNVVFTNHAGPAEGAITGCLRGPPRR
jgi:hypothetical protein